MTFSLGEKSKARLVGVHPSLVAVVESAIGGTKQDFTVFDGRRTLEKQKALKASGASKTLKSKHLIQGDGFGHAVDLVPWIGGEPRWEWGPTYEIALAVQRAAASLGVTNIYWGGVWDRPLVALPSTIKGIQAAVKEYCARHPGPDFIDGPHYQLGV